MRLFPEEAFIFFPSATIEARPDELGLDYEEVRFEADDGARLHGWFVPGAAGGPGVTIVWFHGNAGNISHRLERLAELRRRFGVAVFLFDYRGYGLSSGSPSEQGFYRDGRAAVHEARSRRPDDALVLLGVSLGGAVATQIALDDAPEALVLESAFLSAPAMARTLYPFLFFDPPLRNRFDTRAKLPDVGARILMFHGAKDETVPLKQGQELFELAPEPKRFLAIEGAHDNDLYQVGGETYWSAWRELLDEVAAGR